ncbi:MAG: class I SAM-dependent methyltransferase [Candidatus Hydrogenedentota bacterium]
MNRILQSTIQAYRSHATLFEKRLTSSRRIPPFLFEVARLLAPRSAVLDLGCGTGHDSAYLARHGCRVTAVDATDVFVRGARARCRHQSVRCLCSDMLAFDFPRGKFDLVWANASLIHVPKAKLPGLLRRIRSSLKPGGILAATLHNGRREGIHPGTWIPGRFFASYLKTDLAGLVTDAGFTTRSLRGVVNQDRKGRWLNLIAEP